MPNPPAAAAPLRFRTVTDSDGLRALETDWRALWAGTKQTTCFQAFDWMSTAWEQVARTRGRELRIVVGEDAAGHVVLIWPFVIFSPGLARLLGSETFEYRDLLVADDEHADSRIEAAWAYANDTLGVDRVEFFDVRDDSHIAGFLDRAEPQADRKTAECLSIDCRIDGDWETFFSRLPKSKRTDHRRQWRRLAELGEVDFRLLTEDRDIEDALEWYFEHKLKWLHEGHGRAYRSTTYGGPQHRAFLGEVSKKSARAGTLFLGALTLDGRIIGLAHAVFDHRRIYFMYVGHDEAWQKYSPGRLSMVEMIRAAFDRDLETVDFLVGDMGYKIDWSNARHEKFDYRIALTARGRRALDWAASPTRRRLARCLSRAPLPEAIKWRVDRAFELNCAQVLVEDAQQQLTGTQED